MARRVVAVLAFTLVGTSLPSRAANASKSDFAKEVAQAVELCVQIKLPNSMARPEGFDIRAHVAGLESDYQAKIRKLSTAEGVLGVDTYLSGDRDELSVLCALEIAGETGRAEAVPILKRYETSSIYGVPELVKSYIVKLRSK